MQVILFQYKLLPRQKLRIVQEEVTQLLVLQIKSKILLEHLLLQGKRVITCKAQLVLELPLLKWECPSLQAFIYQDISLILISWLFTKKKGKLFLNMLLKIYCLCQVFSLWSKHKTSLKDSTNHGDLLNCGQITTLLFLQKMKILIKKLKLLQ